MHHLTPDRLERILASSEADALSTQARERLEWIATYVMSGGSVSDVCLRYGIARSTFHRWIDRFDPDDLSTLEEQTRSPLTSRMPAIEDATIELIRGYRQAFPLMGKEKIRTLLKQEHAIDLSSSSIGRVIEREGLYFATTPLHWRKRTQYQKKNLPKEKPTVVQQATVTSVAEAPVAHDVKTCGCFWCAFWSGHGGTIRRSIALASVAVNIALLSGYIATALWEQQGRAVKADLSMRDNYTVSSLDSPIPDGQ